jgi:hypothetical protein
VKLSLPAAALLPLLRAWLLFSRALLLRAGLGGSALGLTLFGRVIGAGALFNLDDYPADLSTLFGLSWSYDALKVPDELQSICESASASQVARHQASMLAAIAVAEEGFLTELANMVSGLQEKLEPVPCSILPGLAPVAAAAVGCNALFADATSWPAPGLVRQRPQAVRQVRLRHHARVGDRDGDDRLAQRQGVAPSPW